MSARGFIRKSNGTWYASVYDSQGKPVLADNTNSFDRLIDQVRCDVAAVRIIEAAGHRIQFSYGELTDAYPKYPKASHES